MMMNGWHFIDSPDKDVSLIRKSLSKLPTAKCVYIYYDTTNPDNRRILYIGRSINPYGRLTHHSVLLRAIADDSIKSFSIGIFYTNQHGALERKMIFENQPAWNEVMYDTKESLAHQSKLNPTNV